MTFAEILNQKETLNQKLIDIKKAYHKKKDSIMKEFTNILKYEALMTNDINIDKIIIAKDILIIKGNPGNICQEKIIAELAAFDIAKKCPKLKTGYFGNKEYSNYYQREDHEYGLGPKHGAIVESVGLIEKYRTKDLNAKQTDACIYYLKNISKIIMIINTNKKNGTCCSECGCYFVKKSNKPGKFNNNELYTHGYPVACHDCYDKDSAVQEQDDNCEVL